MKEWTQEELEKLYVQVQQRAATDKTFREELLADANAAIEKLSGEKLPEGFKVKAIEQDPDYTSTFVIPDLVSEELSQEELQSMAGGVSIAAIVSACAAAVAIPACPADACGAKGCAVDQGCGARACGAFGTVG
ncbi:MAG: NHLP leader peptide family RiPP precursor [Lachnospiraceae bacterium]|nr:NHLP leader peptide family RiPP precursor [Lachnospiraceae bacterium]